MRASIALLAITGQKQNGGETWRQFDNWFVRSSLCKDFSAYSKGDKDLVWTIAVTFDVIIFMVMLEVYSFCFALSDGY